MSYRLRQLAVAVALSVAGYVVAVGILGGRRMDHPDLAHVRSIR